MADEPKQTAMSDVAKPGTTAPDASSKPVIVGHTSVVADPMVSKQPEPVAAAPVVGSMKQRITPTSTGDIVQKEATKEDDAAHAEADVPKKDTSIDKQVRLGELIESGEYNVSIKQKKSSSAALTFFGTLFGVVLLAAIILFVLIDLEVIDVGIKLPFEIFK